MNLYELTSEWERVANMAFEEITEDGQLPEELMEALSVIETDIDRKLSGCCRVIKTMEAVSDAAKKESQRLADKSRSAENHAARLKEYVLSQLSVMGWDSRRCDELFTVAIQKSPNKVVITDMDSIPHQFDKEAKRDVRLTDIKKAIESGQAVPGAELISGVHLRIR